MGIRNALNYLNLLRAAPRKINEDTKKNFSLYLVGSPGLVSEFHEVLTQKMHLDVPPAEADAERVKFIRVLPMPLDEEARRNLKADAVIFLLSLKDATRENLLNYREVSKVNSPAHLFIEEPETSEEKESMYKILDSLNISGREWIQTFSMEEAVKEKADVILDLNKKIPTALAYRFPILRQAMSRKITHATGMQNLVVAMASSLPANLPVVGIIIGFLAAAGETTVITVNQLKMSLQMAGMYGLEMNMFDRIKELWPLVGTALGLRTISRTLVGFIPVAGAPIKGAIAYGGTHFVGETVRWYYETGRRMTREEKRELYQKSREKAITTVREFFENVFKKYPQEMEKKNLHLEEIEEELRNMEEDIKKDTFEELEENTEDLHFSLRETLERARKNRENVEKALETGRNEGVLEENPGSSMDEKIPTSEEIPIKSTQKSDTREEETEKK